MVGDEFGVADTIDAVFVDEGHRVLTAANGRRGLEMLAKQQLDLALSDYMMPVMEGSTMLRTVMENSKLEKVPVVMMNSMPEASVAEQCSSYVAFMRKPSRTAEVIDLALRHIPYLDDLSEKIRPSRSRGVAGFPPLGEVMRMILQ